MSADNGEKPAERHYPEEQRARIDSGETGEKVAASGPAPAPQETEETKFAPRIPEGPEMAPGVQLVESNTKKAIVMFVFASVFVFGALAGIYAWWPR
jgi:hypothetical protein